MTRSSLLATACWLSLLAPGLAAEIAGAEKALERLRAEVPASGAADSQDAAKRDAFLKRAKELAGGVAALSPDEAASRWLALVEEWKTLKGAYPDEAMRETKDFSVVLSSLPGPAAWDALQKAVDARQASPKGAAFQAALRGLIATLRNDAPGRDLALENLRKASKSRESDLSEIEAWLDSLREDPMGVFEKQLLKAEGEGSAGRMSAVPDLVAKLGPERAEDLLKRLMAVEDWDGEIEEGANDTRRLAVKVALKSIDALKSAPWELIASSSPEEGALFEALSRKFPRNDRNDYARTRVQGYYWAFLISQKRYDEATALALESDKRNRGSSLLGYLSGHSGEQILPAEAAGYLRDLLVAHPELPYWNELAGLTTTREALRESVAGLKQALTRENLSAKAKGRIEEQLGRMLLADDQTDEGVRILRKRLEVHMIAIRGDAGEVQKKSGFPGALRELIRGGDAEGESAENDAEEAAGLATQLAILGKLLNNQEWVETGLDHARTAFEKASGENSYLSGWETYLDLLFSLNRQADAEPILVERWINEQKKPRNSYYSFTSSVADLAVYYHRAGRPADVVKLLEQAPGWGKADLVHLTNTYSNRYPLLVVAADSLAAVGRKEEATKILDASLKSSGRSDRAYELLLKLGGDDLLARLDAYAALNRFEERPLIWKAQVLLDAGRLEEAEKTARAAIVIDPSDGEEGKGDRLRAYAVLAEVLAKKGDAKQAGDLRTAVSAIRLSEDADDYRGAGLTSRAIEMYEKSLQLFADAYCIQSRLALTYSRKGDFANAEEHYRRAYELMPDSFGRVESHCFGCEGVFADKQAQPIAERVFSKLAAQPNAKPQVFYLLGYLRSEQGRKAEAAEQYRRAVQLDPDYLNAWSKLADASTSRVDREAATINLLRLDPVGRHENGKLDAVTDFRAAWPVLVEAIKKQPAMPESLLILKASKAELERRKTPREELYFSMEESSQPTRTVGDLLAKHPMIKGLGNLMETSPLQ